MGPTRGRSPCLAVEVSQRSRVQRSQSPEQLISCSCPQYHYYRSTTTMIWPRTHLIACYIAFLWLDINLSGWLTPPLTLAHPVGEIEDFLAAPLFQSLNYKCADSSKLRVGTPKNRFHFRGTSLGGFLVLEPWLTPSLFYQFLGLTSKWGNGAKDHIAIDSLTFCKALGPEEANRQLRIHWRTWVTEDQIKNLAAIGVETLRIPVADWMFEPYEPFIGCWDGSIDELNRVLDLCWKYNLTALLDLHALRGSQNGLDNSGDTGRYEWVGNASADGVTHYRHWDMRGGTWAGLFDSAAQTFSVNTTAILSSLRVVQKIVSLYREHPAVVGFQPVNEPAQSIPFEVLAEYYWRSYQLVRRQAPRWLVLLHDSFRLTPEYWGGSFLQGCDHYAVDIHLYHAWDFDHPVDYFVGQACRDHEHLREMELLGVPVVVGEWSLATDNCAMWLNGLNDNVPYFPKVKCDRVQCPEPYFGRGLVPNAPPDPNTKIDPIGDGGPSYVEFGTCPVDRSYPNEIGDVKKFALAQLYSYDLFTHGFFFWNFRTELETRWDYQKAVRNGWLPTDWYAEETQEAIIAACPADADSPQTVRAINRMVRIGVTFLLVASFALLLFIFVPAVVHHFRIVRSGYVEIQDS